MKRKHIYISLTLPSRKAFTAIPDLPESTPFLSIDSTTSTTQWDAKGIEPREQAKWAWLIRILPWLS
jgi:hypothetical protein